MAVDAKYRKFIDFHRIVGYHFQAARRRARECNYDRPRHQSNFPDTVIGQCDGREHQGGDALLCRRLALRMKDFRASMIMRRGRRLATLRAV